jgi:hypothetical protein
MVHEFGRMASAIREDNEPAPTTWIDTIANWMKTMPRPAEVYHLDAIPIPYPRSGYKAWFAEPDACPSCRELASRPPIPEDQQFGGADVMEPPLHKRCRCLLIVHARSKNYPYYPTPEQLRNEMRKLRKEFNHDDTQ